MCRGIGMYGYRSVTGISLVIMTWNNTWKQFFKRPAVFFRAHSRFILDRSQSRNQGEGAKAASAPFSQVI